MPEARGLPRSGTRPRPGPGRAPLPPQPGVGASSSPRRGVVPSPWHVVGEPARSVRQLRNHAAVLWCRPPARHDATAGCMEHATAHEGMAKTMAGQRPGSYCRVTAPRRRPASPTPCAWCSRCAAYVLHHALRTHPLAPPPWPRRNPPTRLLPLCTVATQGKQCREPISLHLPPSWPVKALWARVPARLSARARPRVAHVLRRHRSPARELAQAPRSAPAARRGRPRGREERGLKRP